MKEKTKNIIKNILIAIGFILAVELVGGFSAMLSGNIKQIYNGLEKPPFSPPSIVFGIVWPLMYLLIGLSLFFVWKTKPKNKKDIYFLFAIQLLLNFLWTILFFKYDLKIVALVDILLLVGTVIWLIKETYKTTKISAILLIPYLAWLLFATYLNIGFIVYN